MVDKTDQTRTPENARAAILIVDDVEVNRQLFSRQLRKRGYSTACARGGKEALEMVQGELPDLILLDIMMPDIDGLEVLRRLRETYSPGELPIIMITALDDPKSIVESLRHGANDYISKPVQYPILSARCVSQLERKAAEDEARKLNAGLEQRVESRTRELQRAYDALKEESRGRKRAQDLLRKREEMYRTLYDDNPTTFFTVDEDFVLLSMNQFGATQLGFEVDDLAGASLAHIHADDDRKVVEDAITECLSCCGETRSWEARLLHKDGHVTWSRATGRSVEKPDGKCHVLVVCEDTTEARLLSEQLSYEARHDPLTGLYNRREFELRLQRAIDSIMTDKAVRHTICYIDLDQFKVVNDNCGHVGGDELLRQLATVLKKRIRAGDVVARLGGDEFGVLLENCSADFSVRVAEDIRNCISEFRFPWDDKSYSIGASIGVVTIDDMVESPSDVMRDADMACYAAKDGGRNRIHVSRPDDEQLAQRHGEMQWVIKIKRALEQDRFRLFAQPIVPLDESESEGLHFEVLIRLLDEHGDIVPPGAFLPAAERYNISSNIDRWVVQKTLQWLQERPDHLNELAVCAINLSGQTLGDKLMLNEIMADLSEYSVPEHKICFEITETAAIANLQIAQEFINTLKSRGCQFALDDFGSGLSSFAYLKNLPVDYLKIDGAFVRNVAEDPVNLAIVRSINDVARVMGKKTVAEFVENKAIIEKLREIGVDYAQGYGIGKPVPIGELIASMASKQGAIK